ncbi:MAG: exodeoxyribonuclease V subunit beta [Pseudohongiellaceae bacterium]|nr:exodeoxyribonuclease V subunit beta [Pseudohongiellaceae bacterium]
MTKRYQKLDLETCLSLPLTGIKLIEASAGTGKTYTIANLYLRYIAQGRKVSEVLVVTFTNAATEELRGRIRERLATALHALEHNTEHEGLDAFLRQWCERCLNSEEPQLIINRLRLAVRTMDEAAIYTIHGFCQRVLSDQAFDSGQAFNLELIDDDAQLWQSALRDWWRKTSYDLDESSVAFFDTVVGSFDTFVQAQTTLRYELHRERVPKVTSSLAQLLSAREHLRPALQSIREQWHKRGEELQAYLLGSKALGRGQKTFYHPNNLKAGFAQLDEYFNSEILSNIPAVFELLSASRLEQDSKPSKLGSDENLQDAFFVDCAEVWERYRSICKSLRIAALNEANEYALSHVEQNKKQSNTLAFSDQLSRVLDALQHDAGASLASNLRLKFPVAMIDEFQDTDNIQYGIFRAIYMGDAADDTGMIMIGDPKQAIYSFRGGDVFAYAEAKKDAGDNLFTLDTNWRSAPNLINAVNTVFSIRDEAFIYEEAIEFQPVLAAEASSKPLTLDGESPAPMTLWQFPLGEDGKPQSKGALRPQIAESVADEVARLLRGARDSKVMLGEEPLKSGDIAVLVRSNSEGDMVRNALLKRGVGAVAAGKNAVFETEEAEGLKLLLDGIVHSDDRRRFRGALASSLLNLSYLEIASIIDDEHASVKWQDNFKGLKKTWLKKGFMAMFYVLLHDLGVGLSLARTDLPERRLTNLLHLAELLQQNARVYPGLESLLSWYCAQLEESGKESELRLESDQDLVQIVTVHASKGLEYKVVFVPYLWDCRPESADALKPLAYHDAADKACLDLGDDERAAHLIMADKERLAEDIRILYVALTRAASKLYLVWGNGGDRQHKDSPRSALAWLLHSARNSASLSTEVLKEDLDPGKMEEDLSRLVEKSAGTISIEPLPVSQGMVQLDSVNEFDQSIAAAQFTGSIATDWRISSFSSLTRDVHQPALGRHAASSTGDSILDFEAGSHVGLFLHNLLEDIDFKKPIDQQVERAIQVYAPQFGLQEVAEGPLMTQWVHNVLNTPLNDSGLCLAQIPQSKRLNELSFDFAIGQLNLIALNDTLSEWAGEKLEPIGFERLSGLITGIVDLIFEHEGRYYVADYKSNYLGGALADYEPEKLRRAIFDRRYDLQYLLYLLALHRYLRQRIPNYDYNESMGGVYYLFLRGMRPDSGPRFGVHFDLPPKSLIETLDTQIFGLPKQLLEAAL